MIARGVEVEAALRRRASAGIRSPRDRTASPSTPALRAALGDADGVACFAGHDAGILAERLPAAMVLTRNPTGVSHSPDEAADLDDAAAAATAILEVVR